MTQIVLLSLVMTLVVNGVLHAEPSIGADGALFIGLGDGNVYAVGR